MASREHLTLLKEGVTVWNKWRQVNNREQIDLSEMNLSMINLRGADLRGANLVAVKLIGTNLSGASLSGADLAQADLHEANLSKADLIGTDLIEAKLIGADLRGARLSRADLTKANLQGADLRAVLLDGANLREANLSETKLCGANLRTANIRKTSFLKADLREADLSKAIASKANFTEAKLNGAKLVETQAMGTIFVGAKMTRVCLENWTIDTATQLDEVVCDYFYLKMHDQDRYPVKGNLAPGEFSQLFQESFCTLDLLFPYGIAWEAFAEAFKQLELENGDARLTIRNIENQRDGSVVVKVNVADYANRILLYEAFMHHYEAAIINLNGMGVPLSHKDLQVLRGKKENQPQRQEINQLLHLLKQPIANRKSAKLGHRSRPYGLRRSRITG